MPVEVYRPKQEQYREGDKKDALDTLAQALGIAASGYGIYTDYQKLQSMKENQKLSAEDRAVNQEEIARKKAAIERGQKGRMTESEYQDVLSTQKFVEIAPPKQGEEMPTSTLKRFVIGENGTERPVILRQVKPLEMETSASTAEKKKTALEAAAEEKRASEAAAAGSKAKEKSEGIRLEKAKTLQSRYEADPTVKDSKNIASSWERVQGSFQNPSAAGDLNLIFGYMKMLDPGSTVREGEFANAQNAGGIPDRVLAQYNKVREGTRLSENQRKDFFSQAKSVVAGQFKQQQKIDEAYKNQLKRGGIDPEDFMFVPGIEVKGSDTGASLPKNRMSGSIMTQRQPMKASQLPDL
jgi:hypothetical protein